MGQLHKKQMIAPAFLILDDGHHSTANCFFLICDRLTLHSTTAGLSSDKTFILNRLHKDYRCSSTPTPSHPSYSLVTTRNAFFVDSCVEVTQNGKQFRSVFVPLPAP